MANKAIPKALLDKALDMERSYWGSGEPGCEVIFDCFKRIQHKTGIDLHTINHLCSAILPSFGLKPDATNEDIYAVLRLLGWEVSE